MVKYRGMSNPISISEKITVGGGKPLLVIAGPCQIESLEHCLMIGARVQQLCAKFGFSYVFKSSFDKANRTSLKGQRGPGIEEGLRVLDEVRRRLAVPVITDIHSEEQAQLASEVADVLQTPAFLCRQTDLLAAVGRTGKAVNIKKGQFLAPEDMRFVAEKVSATGNNRIMLCERGACFGYRDLVVDMRSLVIMAESGYPVVFDATHSVQSMGGAGGSSAGQRKFVPPLLRAALAVGVDGIFIETHENPAQAPSDGASMIPLAEMESLLGDASRIHLAAMQK